MAKAVADRWIAPFDIENLMVATDPRLWQVKPRELLAAFSIKAQSVFERPTRGARDAEGLERVSAVNPAWLLIQLERAGMAIDPMPVVSALAPTIGAKRLLTTPELMVHWRAQGYRGEGIQFSTARPEIGCAGPACTTLAGYTVRGFYEADPESDCGEEGRTDVVMLTVYPSNERTFRLAPVRSGPGRKHLRKYLGEPQANRQPSPRSTA